jgi:hypothetical protein
LRGLPLNRRQWITHQSNNLVSSKPNEVSASNAPDGLIEMPGLSAVDVPTTVLRRDISR